MRGLRNDLYQCLLLYDILSSRAFGAVYDIKGYSCSFLKGLEALSLNCGMMYEYILTAILLNKTKTF